MFDVQSIYIIATLLCLFFWEHLGRVNGWIVFRPTYPLLKLVSFLQNIFYYLGVLFGRIGSLAAHLHLEEFIETFTVILTRFIRLITTPQNIFEGINHEAKLYGNRFDVVILSIVGTIFGPIILLSAYCYYYF